MKERREERERESESERERERVTANLQINGNRKWGIQDWGDLKWGWGEKLNPGGWNGVALWAHLGAC